MSLLCVVPSFWGNAVFVHVFMLWLVFVVCLSNSLVCFVCALPLVSCLFCFWCVFFVCGVLCCRVLFHRFVVRVRFAVVVLFSCFFVTV